MPKKNITKIPDRKKLELSDVKKQELYNGGHIFDRFLNKIPKSTKEVWIIPWNKSSNSFDMEEFNQLLATSKVKFRSEKLVMFILKSIKGLRRSRYYSYSFLGTWSPFPNIMHYRAVGCLFYIIFLILAVVLGFVLELPLLAIFVVALGMFINCVFMFMGSEQEHKIETYCHHRVVSFERILRIAEAKYRLKHLGCNISLGPNGSWLVLDLSKMIEEDEKKREEMRRMDEAEGGEVTPEVSRGKGTSSGLGTPGVAGVYDSRVDYEDMSRFTRMPLLAEEDEIPRIEAHHFEPVKLKYTGVVEKVKKKVKEEEEEDDDDEEDEGGEGLDLHISEVLVPASDDGRVNTEADIRINGERMRLKSGGTSRAGDSQL